MAATYSVRFNAITNAINKTMLTINNASGSGVIVRVYRMWFISNSTANVTGGIGIYVLDRFTGTPGGGNAKTASKHNTASGAVPAQVTFLGGNSTITGTLTTAGIIRVVARSNDEIAVGGNTMEEFQELYPLSLIFDAGYGDSNVEPIVLREAEGLRLYTMNLGTFGASTADIFAEMTIT